MTRVDLAPGVSFVSGADAERAYRHDDLWPRDDPRFRYRLYALDRDGLRVLAAAPDPGGIGQAICTLHADAREKGKTLGDEGRIGILDVRPDGRDDDRGEWVLSPYERSRT